MMTNQGDIWQLAQLTNQQTETYFSASHRIPE
jgi:hypothetical protein